MALHYWSDESFDWLNLDRAITFIGEGLCRWRIDVMQYKEKFGGARVYCTLGLLSFEQLIRPGWAMSQWPYWARWLEYTRPARLLRHCINWAVMPFHRWIYRWYYQEAVRRWPHLRDEIVEPADWPELLKGL